MKRTPRTFRLKTTTNERIENLKLMLDLENDTEVIEKAIKFYYTYAKTFTNTTTGQEIQKIFEEITND